MLTQLENLSGKKLLLMLVLLFIPLYLFYLGAPSLWEEDETIYAEISREMVLRNDYIGTYFNYAPRYDKPPLNFWVNTGFYRFFGINEFTSRLGSTIFGFLGLLLVYLFGKRLFNKRTGIISALILGTGFLYFIETQMAIIDTSLTFFIGLTLYCFYRGYFEQKPNFLIWMGVPLGLGIMAKGPVALVLAGSCALVFWLYQTYRSKVSWKKLFNWQLALGFVIALAISLPWYLVMWSRYGMAFLESHFGYHMIQRFTTPIESHGGAWYFSLYYIVFLLIGFMPWSANIPSSLLTAAKQWAQPKVFFLLSWLLVTFGFFTIAQTKLPGYTLPLFPPMAILLGYWWDQKISSPKVQAGQWWGIGFQLLIVLAFVGLIASQKSRLPSGYENIVSLLFLLPICLLGGAIVTFLYYLKNKNDNKPFFEVTFVTFYLFWALFMLLLVPVIENFKPIKYLAADLHKQLKSSDRVVSAISGSSKGAPFYIRHRVIFVTKNERLEQEILEPTRTFALIEEHSLNFLKGRKVKFYLLAHHGSGYLIANRPLK